ncbi:hypothetical protein [Aeoliella mucimassa]|uniref:hypothetical protein n=1 Tax=Aeoliella mucimassa TaxID=2527972 RepID=UPI00119D8C62|nr:hypothetical protein [Aeoliella mucimassa]
MALQQVSSFAQTPIYWIGPDNGSYNQDSNWDLGVPGFLPGDIAVIGSETQLTGIATLNSTPYSPGGLILGDVADSAGTLNMQGGSLDVQAQSGTTGRIDVGLAGSGTLNVSGGTLTSVELIGHIGSTVNLSGGNITATRIAHLNGTTTLTSTAVTISAGTLVLGQYSNYSPSVTASGVPLMQVTGGAALGGQITMNFNAGQSASVGDTWDLFEADFIESNINTIQATGIDELPAWQTFRLKTVDTGSGRQRGQVELAETLRLRVNPENGELSIISGTAGGVSINGYQITSNAEWLDPSAGAWTPLPTASGWNQANVSSSQLAQLKSSAGGLTVSQSAEVSLGTPYQGEINSLPFGTRPGNDLTFTYNTTDGETLQGIVELESDFYNNLVLTIDPDDGMAELRNDSRYTVPFDSYQLTSVAGALNAAGWDELGSAWQVANQTLVDAGTQLAEVNPDSRRVLGPGQRLLLGTIFPDVATIDPTADLALLVANSDRDAAIRVANAVIRVGDVEPLIDQPGDFNGDGIVNLGDYTLWRDNLGTANEDVINNAGNGNNVVDAGDYEIWKSNFGATAGAVQGVIGNSVVPEPQAMALLALASLALTVIGRTKRG